MENFHAGVLRVQTREPHAFRESRPGTGCISPGRIHETEFRDVLWSSKNTKGELLVQTSAHGKPKLANLEDGFLVWKEAHSKVASGQSLVFYQKDQVIGGAIAI